MINYRVDNIEALIDVLRREGVTILDKMIKVRMAE